MGVWDLFACWSVLGSHGNDVVPVLRFPVVFDYAVELKQAQEICEVMGGIAQHLALARLWVQGFVVKVHCGPKFPE